MILGPISLLDCVIFLIFLVPQLFIHVSIVELLGAALGILPFFLLRLPLGLFVDRVLKSRLQQPPFVQRATFFQDLVIRCVRYAFANLPATIGRVFFSKHVALPFTRFRMLRHGIFTAPVNWEYIDTGKGAKGVWISGTDDSEPPDVVVYYCHGGGFSMGSAYFYLEPLIALRDFLVMHYRNPAVFALEYTLVPDAAYPTQIKETVAGYDYVLSRVNGDASRICVAGDSAGGTLVLSMLLHMAQDGSKIDKKRPGYAALISPWTNLVSEKHRNTKSDYLNDSSLHLYGSQYAKEKDQISDPLISPGDCTSASLWQKASPSQGFYCAWGSEEVLGPDVKDLIKRWRQAGLSVTANEEPGGVHAWVIAALFLEASMEQRSRGMKDLVQAIVTNIR